MTKICNVIISLSRVTSTSNDLLFFLGLRCTSLQLDSTQQKVLGRIVLCNCWVPSKGRTFQKREKKMDDLIKRVNTTFQGMHLSFVTELTEDNLLRKDILFGRINHGTVKLYTSM